MFPRAEPLMPEEVPALLPEQLSRFSRASLGAKPVRSFDARQSLDALRGQQGKSVIAVDIGGDKLTASYFTVDQGVPRPAGHILARQGDDGDGYLEALRELRDLARAQGFPVGISFAGPTDGTRIVAGPNLSLFTREFADSCDSDFAALFPAVELANDAEAGIMAGALEAAVRYPGAHDVIYVINGSGLGGAALVGGTIYAAEPGHVAVVDRLNRIAGFSQRKQCGLGGATHVCIESVAASKAGIEDIWRQVAGQRLAGREIAARYAAGDELARALYHNSASITAHAIAGMVAAFRLHPETGRLVVVAHGGIFQVPGYGQRVQALLARNLPAAPLMLFTKDFSANTCLEGAAIAAAARDA